jgi:hypothetical protein
MDLHKHVENQWLDIWLQFVSRQEISWSAITLNENTTFELMQRHSNKPWKWSIAGVKPNITFDIILQHPDKFNNWLAISRNPNITFDMVEAHFDKEWNWGNLSNNPTLTMEIIKRYPDKQWNWGNISANPNITINDIIKHINDYPWNISVISRDKVTMEIVEKYPHINWDLGIMHLNPNITIDMMLKYSNHRHGRWWLLQWGEISKNPNLTIKHIIDNPHIRWDWYAISANPNITVDDIKQHPELPWDNDVMWLNSNYGQRKEQPRNFKQTSANPRLLMNAVNEHENKECDWHEIGKNTFSADKRLFIKCRIQFLSNVMQIHDYYNTNPYEVQTICETLIYNNYLMMQIIKY